MELTRLNHSSLFFMILIVVTVAWQSYNQIYNRYISMETNSPTTKVGDPVEIELFYEDKVFEPGADPVFHLFIEHTTTGIVRECFTISGTKNSSYAGMYPNVLVTLFEFMEPGQFEISLDMDSLNLPDEDPLYLKIQVTLPVEEHCKNVGSIVVSRSETSTDAIEEIRNYKAFTRLISEQIVISSSTDVACREWSSLVPKWTISKLKMNFTVMISACLYPTLFKNVNLSEISKHILAIPLPALSRESGFIIQPFSLPPGVYRICSVIAKSDIHIRQCILINLEADQSHSKFFEDSLQVKMNHKMNEFTWPMTKPLKLDVLQYYSYFALAGAGHTGNVIYRYYWSCDGGDICKKLQSLQKIVNSSDNLLNIKETAIIIPTEIMHQSGTLLLNFTLEYNDPLFFNIHCQKSFTRKIIFVSSMIAGISLRCYLNCWKKLNPERPLLVGLDFDLKTSSEENMFTFRWSINGKVNFQETSCYLLVKNYVPDFEMKIVVKVYVTYIDSNQIKKEIILARHFYYADATISPLAGRLGPSGGSRKTSLRSTGEIKESWINKMTQNGSLAIHLPRYNVSTKVIAFSRPVVVTVSIHAPNEEYVLLRSLWAPFDFCVEHSAGDQEINSSIEIFSKEGLALSTISINQFQVMGENDTHVEELNLGKLWLLATQDWDSFVVNDETYLAVISAIIRKMNITSIDVFRNNLLHTSTTMKPFNTNFTNTEPQEPDFQEDFSTSFNHSKLTLPEDASYDMIDDTFKIVQNDGKQTFEVLPEATPVASATLRGVTLLAEKILDFLTDPNKHSTLTYSNINLQLLTAKRLLFVSNCAAVILEKSLIVLVLAQNLHQSIWNDPHGDAELIRLKLDLVNAIIQYNMKCPSLADNIVEDKELTTSVFDLIYRIINDAAKRNPWKFPRVVSYICPDQYALNTFWLNPHVEGQVLSLNMMFVQLTINMNGYQAPLFRRRVNSFVNIAVYAAPQYLLPSGSMVGQIAVKVNAPVVLISLTSKQPSYPPYVPPVPNSYDIKFKYDSDHTPATEIDMHLEVYKSVYSNGTNESACIFFMVDATFYYASIVTFKPQYPGLILNIRLELTNQLSSGLETIFSDRVHLPHNISNDSCQEFAPDSYSIFLPALSSKQRINLRGPKKYYIILEVEDHQVFPGNYQKVPGSDLLEVAEVLVVTSCMQVSCLNWENDAYSFGGCKPNRCSGGNSSMFTCQCKSGSIFTGSMNLCGDSKFTIINEKHLELSTFNFSKDGNCLAPAFLIIVWMIFLALLKITYTSDTWEGHFGKTFALEGVFNPYKCDQYLMCISTSHGKWKGSNMTAFLTMVGSKSNSVRYKLETDDYLFVSGSEIWLLVSVPPDIGDLKACVISLEPDDVGNLYWGVDQVYIINIWTGQECTCFLKSRIPDNKNFGFFFIIANFTNMKVGWKVVFGSVLKRLLANQHPLLGMFIGIPGRMFSKAQHTIFCFCGMLFIMCMFLLSSPLPTQKLAGDLELPPEAFSLDVQQFFHALGLALQALLPMYIVGKLLEIARPIDTFNVLARFQVKHRDEWSPFQATKDAPTPTDDQFLFVGEEISSDNKKVAACARLIKELRNSKSSQAQQNLSSSAGWKYIKLCQLACDVILTVPTNLVLAALWSLIVGFSWYIFLQGALLSLKLSKELVLVSTVGFFLLLCAIYPVWLIMMAAVNILFFLRHKPFYGPATEAASRIKEVCVVLPDLVKMTKMGLIVPRVKVSQSDQNLNEATFARSKRWCHQLLSRKPHAERNSVIYTTPQIVIFTVLCLLIINLVSGSIHVVFWRNNYILKSLDLNYLTELKDKGKALTVEDIFHHLRNISETFAGWSNKTYTSTTLFLSAIRIRQIRVRPYLGECSQHFPDLIQPECRFEIDQSVIETRNFNMSWQRLLTTGESKPSPYTYTKTEKHQIYTPLHGYPPGGYEVLMSATGASQNVLTDLKDTNWIDELTKAVFVNINMMNLDSGLTTITQHMYEFSEAGIFMFTTDAFTFPVLMSEDSQLVLSCAIVGLTLLTVFFLTSEVQACFSMGAVNYWKLPDSWVGLLERILSVAVIAKYFWMERDKNIKKRLVKEIFAIEMSDSRYIDMVSLSRNAMEFVSISCVLVLTCFIKLMLNFRKYGYLKKFVNLVPTATKLGICPFLAFVSFGCLGYLQFHTRVAYYSNFQTSLATASLILMEQSSLKPTIDEFTGIGVTYVVVLYIVCNCFVLNFFIVLLSDSYSELQLAQRKKL